MFLTFNEVILTKLLVLARNEYVAWPYPTTVRTVVMADGKTLYKQHLLDLCDKCGDELGRNVRGRILGAQSHLHAADARYHRKCSAAFHGSTQKTNDTDSKSTADD